jgi:hypothetical protein
MEKYEEEEAKKLSLYDACSFRNKKIINIGETKYIGPMAVLLSCCN